MKITLSLLSTVLIGFSLPAWAADEEEELRFYDVEIIIFKNDRGPRSKEFILPVSSPKMDDEILDLASPHSIETAKEKLYEIVPKEELKLQEQVLSIAKSRRYSLLAHVGWRQPGLSKEETMPIWIKGGRLYGNEFISIDDQIDTEAMHELDIFDLEDPALAGEQESSESGEDVSGSNTGETSSSSDAELSELEQELQDSINAELGINNVPEPEVDGLYELEGRISIALARYLHTSADLVLRKPRINSQDPGLEENESDLAVESVRSDALILNNHSLKESRRMRSNKLHYLDSPEFSMLVLITPYEIPIDDEMQDSEQVGELIEPTATVETQ